jgi:hypothetical protein
MPQSHQGDLYHASFRHQCLHRGNLTAIKGVRLFKNHKKIDLLGIDGFISHN